jgi:hypothetical protein
MALVPLIIRWGAETRAGALIRQGDWRHVRATGQALKNCKNLRERRYGTQLGDLCTNWCRNDDSGPEDTGS